MLAKEMFLDSIGTLITLGFFGGLLFLKGLLIYIVFKETINLFKRKIFTKTR